MTESRIPKHAVSTVSESIAENHNCFKVKGYWVQLYIKKEDNNLYNLPDDEVLEDLEMTKESFLEEFPQFNVLVTKNKMPKFRKTVLRAIEEFELYHECPDIRKECAGCGQVVFPMRVNCRRDCRIDMDEAITEKWIRPYYCAVCLK